MRSYWPLVALGVATSCAARAADGPERPGAKQAREPTLTTGGDQPEEHYEGCLPVESRPADVQTCTTWILPAPIADGGSPKSRAEAAKIYEVAKYLGDTGAFGPAIEKLERAYQLAPEPVLLYNIARMHEFNRNLDCAADAYRIFVREAPQNDLVPETQKRLDRLDLERKLGPPPIDYTSDRCEGPKRKGD